MNGFETVEKLKEMEQKATPHTHYLEDTYHTTVGSAESDLVLRNAAPLLLDVAGQIQPGDRQGFLELIYIIEDMRIDESCPVCEERLVGYKELIKRYQKMAERMHEG